MSASSAPWSCAFDAGRERTDDRPGPAAVPPDARVLAFVVAVAGFVNVISGLTPSLAARVHLAAAGLTPDVRQLAHGATALLGIALILLARGLAIAVASRSPAAIALLGISVVTHVAKGLDIEEAAMMVSSAGLLIRGRRLFTEPTPRPGGNHCCVGAGHHRLRPRLRAARAWLRHDRVPEPALTFPSRSRRSAHGSSAESDRCTSKAGSDTGSPIWITVLGSSAS